MTVVGIFALRLAGPGRQEVLQGPKTVLDPVAPLPRPYEPWPAESVFKAHQIELLLPGLTDHENRHRPIRWTGGPQPHIAHSRRLRALTPGPRAGLLQGTPLDLAPIRQLEGVGTLPFHEECPLVGWRDMAHELRVAKPTIGHNHR